MTYLFLDTMVFLHYPPLEQIEFLALLPANEVTVVLPRITVQELDKHKDNHRSTRIRRRAQKRLSAIVEWLDSSEEIRSGVHIQYFVPSHSFDYLHHGLDKTSNDDVLLASVLQFKSEHSSSEVLLVSQDTGPHLTARHLGIDARRLPDSLQLPREENPLERENRELRNKILKLQASSPELVLRFSESSKDHLDVRLRGIEVAEIDEKEVLRQLQRSYPKQHPPGNLAPRELLRDLSSLNDS